jgi:hypothetical protein
MGRTRPTFGAGWIAVAVAVLVLGMHSSVASACGIGRLIGERVLLRPKAATFYAEDALNPDVVRYRGRYLMFFSGNPVQSANGDWRTGVAIAKRPLGPFRVDRRLKGRFLNGGTTVSGGRLLQATSALDRKLPALLTSRDGVNWRRFGAFPEGSGWHTGQADFFLDQRQDWLDAYFLARPAGAQFYGSIAKARYRNGRWYGFNRIIAPSPKLIDLGEPAVFRAGGSTYLLYVGLKPTGGPRNIYLAKQEGHKWVSCGSQPFIAAKRSWYEQNAIDPTPLVRGNRLYVYFGGGVVPSIGAGMNGTIGVRIYRLRR